MIKMDTKSIDFPVLLCKLLSLQHAAIGDGVNKILDT